MPSIRHAHAIPQRGGTKRENVANSFSGGAARHAHPGTRLGPGDRRLAGLRRGQGRQRRCPARRRGDAYEDRHRHSPHGVHQRRRCLRLPQPAGRALPPEGGAAGVQHHVQEGIVLQVNSNPTIDVTMTVGSIGEQVTVTAESPVIETRSTGVGQVIDNQQVTQMPLNGRQATELIFLSGLATTAPSGDLNTNKNFPTVTISVAGGQANGITYIMDGGTHNDPFNNLNLPTPFPDALQEFKVETSALPARYGHHAASAVNLVTKSGSNQVHGDLFEFVRDYHFHERNFCAPERDNLKRNQFGGTVGAPIVKNKLFAFGGYQGRIEKSTPPTSISFVPTAAMLQGDFTTFASAACNGGTAKTLTGGFVGNRIDPSRLSPVSLNLLKHVPVSTDPCGKIQYGIPNNNTEHQGLAKVDYAIPANSSLSPRYFYAVYDNPATYDGANALTLSRTGQNNQVHSLVLGHNQVLSASTLNSLHVTINRTLNDRPLPEYFSATD